ncbi:MAG: SLATT domain-containing protein [Nitrospira sp.]
MTDEKRVFSPIGTDQLLTGWLVHCHKARDRHDEAARRYAKGQFALGIPSLIVSTVVGTSVFAALSSKEVPPLWVGLLSILAAVLAALQTFMDFGSRSDKHRSAAVKYKSSIRLIEKSLVQEKQGMALTKDEIDAIRTTLDGQEETAPVVMPAIYASVEKKYQDMKYVSDVIGLYSKS